MEKGLTIRTGQTHVQRYMPKLPDMILKGKIDTTFLISHRLARNRRRMDIKSSKAGTRHPCWSLRVLVVACVTPKWGQNLHRTYI